MIGIDSDQSTTDLDGVGYITSSEKSLHISMGQNFLLAT